MAKHISNENVAELFIKEVKKISTFLDGGGYKSFQFPSLDSPRKMSA